MLAVGRSLVAWLAAADGDWDPSSDPPIGGRLVTEGWATARGLLVYSSRALAAASVSAGV